MKKIILIVVIMLVLGGFVVCAIFYTKKEIIIAPIHGNQEIPDLATIVMEYKYLGKTEYMDTPHDMLRLEPGEPFTISLIARKDETLKNHGNLFQFTWSLEFDFENYVLLNSFGREIRELECIYDSFLGGYVMSITYDKEYQGNTVFFYKIEKRNYVSPDFISFCYWLDGGERVCLGDAYALTTPNKEKVREHELWLESLQGDSE